MKLAIAGALACLSGCVPMVAHYQDDIPSRRNVEKAMERAELQRMSREEVLLRFGEPDRGGPETFEYVWTKVWMAIMLPPGRMTDVHRLTLTFEKDRIAHVHALSEWGCAWGYSDDPGFMGPSLPRIWVPPFAIWP